MNVAMVLCALAHLALCAPLHEAPASRLRQSFALVVYYFIIKTHKKGGHLLSAPLLHSLQCVQVMQMKVEFEHTFPSP